MYQDPDTQTHVHIRIDKINYLPHLHFQRKYQNIRYQGHILCKLSDIAHHIDLYTDVHISISYYIYYYIFLYHIAHDIISYIFYEYIQLCILQYNPHIFRNIFFDILTHVDIYSYISVSKYIPYCMAVYIHVHISILSHKDEYMEYAKFPLNIYHMFLDKDGHSSKLLYMALCNLILQLGYNSNSFEYVHMAKIFLLFDDIYSYCNLLRILANIYDHIEEYYYMAHRI